MTYFIYITLPLLMILALVGTWLSILPILVALIAIVYAATWIFG